MILKYNLFKLILFILLLLPITIWSQSVIGKIVNSQNNPLEFASVSIINPNNSVAIDATTTNKLGEFELTNLMDISSTNDLRTSELTKIYKKEYVYHIVVGTFSNHNNAIKKVNQLSVLGYKASVLGMNQSGLIRVTIDSYTNSVDARYNLSKIKKNVEKDAWLLIEEKESNEIKSNERASKIDYIFQVHLVGYKKYQKPIYLEGKTLNIGTITLENFNVLEEVILTLVVPFTIKKDTVSYNAKAFKIRVDDTVEDLLKKLPGIEVDATGKITA